MKSIFVYEFEDYIIRTIGIINVQRVLKNVRQVLQRVSGGNPITEINGKILQAVLYEARLMKNEPDVNEWLMDDVKVLYNFCVKNGVLLEAAD